MSIIHQLPPDPPPNFVPLTVDQYHQMIGQGVLRDGEPIELIDGMLVRKDRGDRGGDPMSHGTRYSSAVVGLQEGLDGVKAAGCHLRIQLPVTLGSTQEPEPDVGVIRGKRQQFTQRHPRPEDIVALIEASDSSLTFDRTIKQRIYAAANISIYWIVNLVDMQIEVYQDPRPEAGKYGSRVVYRSGETVTLGIAPGVEVVVSVADALPS